MQMCQDSDSIFTYFFNMDISLIKALSCLEICMYIAKICLEGRVSQNFDKGLRFCLMVCRRWNFCHKIKTKAHTNR